MQRQAYSGAPSSFEGFPVNPERSHLAPGKEHHVPAFHLQAVVTDAEFLSGARIVPGERFGS